MSSRWAQLIRNSGDPNAGAAVLRLATMAAALHQVEMIELTCGADGAARTANVPRTADASGGRAGDREVAR